METKMLDTLGARIEAMRKRKKINQRKVVDLLARAGTDIGYPHYSKIENDNVLPSLDVLAAIASVLECTTDYLLMRTDVPESRVAGLVVDHLDDDIRECVESVYAMFVKLDKERKDLETDLSEAYDLPDETHRKPSVGIIKRRKAQPTQ